ncbi:MAG: SIMPL domain-containing protein [Patescibacteria group bacterium]|nr:SIMPL domain-containing protein [Patescibacteria group bacterium]
MNYFKSSLKLLALFILIVVLLWLIKFFDISYPVTITTKNQSSELVVVGEGKIEVVPDVAFVEAGVVVDNQPTAKEAKDKLDSINNKIIKALGDIGIKKEDIKTTNYSIYPNYKYENNVNVISGYNGNAQIEVKIKNDSQLLTRVISLFMDSGANQIQRVRFMIDKPELYREKAREKAIQNAKDQAEKLSRDLGISLGKITNIVESFDGQSQGGYYRPMILAEEGGIGGQAPLLEAGSRTVISIVRLHFEKK